MVVLLIEVLFQTITFAEALPEPLPQDVEVLSEKDLPSLFQSAKWSEAATLLRGMIRREPEKKERSLELVRVLLFMGQRLEAIDLLSEVFSTLNEAEKRKALVLESAVWNQFLSSDALQKYERGLEPLFRGRWEDAALHFEAAMRLEPFNVKPALRYAQAKLQMGQPSDAIRVLEPLLSRGREKPEVEIAFWLGKALLKNKQYTEAIQRFRKIPPDFNEELPLLLAEALVQNGRIQEAIDVLSADLNRSPSHVLSLMRRSELRTRLMPRRRDSADIYREAQKDIQLAISRIEEFEERRSQRARSEWGLDTLESEGIRTELEERLQILRASPKLVPDPAQTP